MTEKRTEYTADMIEVLTATEVIRRRPAMYLGPVTDPLAATRLLQESLCLALDAACCGACTRIAVTLHGDGSATVADDGPGLSLKPSTDGRPEAELIMNELAGCYIHLRREVFGACNIGVAVTNALSDWCVLTTAYEGGRWRQRYRHGVPQGSFERLVGEAATGTKVSFMPDRAIFGGMRIDAAPFVAWVRGLDLPLDQVDVRLTDERTRYDATVRPHASRPPQ